LGVRGVSEAYPAAIINALLDSLKAKTATSFFAILSLNVYNSITQTELKVTEKNTRTMGLPNLAIRDTCRIPYQVKVELGIFL